MSNTAGSIRAGKAHVELGVDEKPLDKGLGNAESKLKSFGKSMEKAAKSSGGSLFSAGSLSAGPMGIAAAAAGVAAKALFEEFVSNPRQLADIVQRSTELTAQSLEQFTHRLEESRAAMARLDDVAATPGAMRARQSEFEKSQKELDGLEKGLRDARKEHESFQSMWGSSGNTSLWLSAPISGGLEGQREITGKKLEEAQTRYNEALKRSVELQKQLTELRDPQKNASAKDSIESFTKSLAEQVRMLEEKNTLTKEDVELQKLSEKFGWNDKHFRFQEAKSTIQKLRVAEANDALDDFTKAVNDEAKRIERVDLTDREFELMQLTEKYKTDPNNPKFLQAKEALQRLNIADAVEAANQRLIDYGDTAATITSNMTRGGFSFANASQFLGTGEGSGFQGQFLRKQDEIVTAVNNVAAVIEESNGGVIV